MIKSRRMKWVGYVARMGIRGMHIGICWESQKERDHWDFDVKDRRKETTRKI
jgi:hypothetical protein